ncbi:MAG: DEAD/DEAH box helicase [Bacteroidales bacterium]|nr:DEAD/DEAH box helicase [Bacteroidales bacterium]
MDYKTDFHRQYESLSAKEKFLIKLFILTVEPVYHNAFDEILKNGYIAEHKKTTFLKRECKELESKGLLINVAYDSYIFPPEYQVFYYHIVCKEMPEMAIALDKHLSNRSHFFYYYSGDYRFIKLFRRFLIVSNIPALGSMPIQVSGHELSSYQSFIIKMLFRNPSYHKQLKKMEASSAFEVYNGEFLPLVESLLPLDVFLGNFLLLMELQESMNTFQESKAVRAQLADFLYSTSGIFPMDNENKPLENEIKMPKAFTINQIYKLNDTKQFDIVGGYAKELFVLKNRAFDKQTPIFRYVFLMSIIANPDLLGPWKAKIERFFRPSDSEITDFKAIVLFILMQKEALNSYYKMFSRFTWTQLGWVEYWSAIIAAYLAEIRLSPPSLENAMDLLHALIKAQYLRPALELSFVLDKMTNESIVEELYKALERKLGTPALISSIRIKPEYERKLEALIQISQAYKQDEKAGSDSRVSYLLNHKDATIQPVLQTRTQNGWSKGRNISLQKIADLDFENLLVQDKNFTTTIKDTKSFYGPKYGIDRRLSWRALVGHPHLFSFVDPSIPIELVLVKPSLVVQKKEKKYHFQFDYLPKDFTFPVIKETETRYLFIDIDLNTSRILEQMPSGLLRIPETATDLVKKTVAGLSQIVNVFADQQAGGENTLVKKQETDSILRVLLTPSGDGLRAQITAKPFGEQPPYCIPGEGAHTVFSQIKNERMQVTRNLNTENEYLTSLLSQISAAGLDIEDQYILYFEDPSSALDLLEVLHNCQDICKIEWPEGVKFSFRGAVQLIDLSLNIKKSGNWFDLDGDLRIDEKLVIDMKTLLEKKRSKGQRFLEISDGEFVRLSDALRRKLDELQSFAFVEKKGLKLSPLMLPAIFDGAEELQGYKYDKAAKEFQKRFDQAQEKNFLIPETLKAELRPYQEDGFYWMARLSEWGAGACLADDMGLGKTVQSIALLLHKASLGASMVVCPASVLPNWLAELNRFAPVLRPVILGNNGREQTISSLDAFDVLITTYGLLQSEEELIGEFEWNVVILDEAHVIKNHQTKTFVAASKLKAGSRIALTGTPIQNRMDELWSIFSFINPGLLGNLKSFNSRFAQPAAANTDSSQKSILKRIISPFILRRLKQNVLDELPPKTEIVLSVELSDLEQGFYEALRQQAIENIKSDDQPGIALIKALAEITRLRLASCNVQLVDKSLQIPSSKLSVFLELISELSANKHRALVFSQFTSHLSLVKEALDRKKIDYLYLDGSTPIKQRGKLVKDFQQGQIPLFLISLKAGGLGLNLTAADFVIHLDPWWNPAVEDQATDRAHRIGQNRPVTVYRIVAKNTIEEKIIQLHNTKREMAESILQGNDAPSKLSINEMIQLLQGGL